MIAASSQEVLSRATMSAGFDGGVLSKVDICQVAVGEEQGRAK
jgi:hypothetical protein